MNVVYISGRFGHHPQVKATTTGKSVMREQIAIDDYRNGEKQTSWIDFEAWDKTAELINRSFDEGDMIGLFGKLKKDTWKKDGNTMSKTYVLVSQVEFYGSKRQEAPSISKDEGFEPMIDTEGDLPF